MRLLFERLATAGRDARALHGARVAAIGPATARALRAHGVLTDVCRCAPSPSRSWRRSASARARRALVARAKVARDVLPDALRARGTEVDVLELYETVAEPLPPSSSKPRAADYVTFTSASTVRFFLQAADSPLSPHTRIVSIGPITSAALREHGLEPHVEAENHDIDGLLQALLADVAAQRH